MLKNYIKTAWRNILKRKMTSLISVSSLAVGLAVCFMIGLYLIHELSYDRFIPDSERVVRVVLDMENGYRAAAPPGLAHALERDLPGIETLTEVSHAYGTLFTSTREPFNADRMFWADSNFAKIFSPTVLEGDLDRALALPGNIVLTRSTADRLFGDKTATGQTMALELQPGYEVDMTVAAIVADPPSNLHFSYNGLLSLATPRQIERRYSGEIEWYFFGGYVYVKLQDQVDVAMLQDRMDHLEEQMDKPGGGYDRQMLTAQPLTDIHLAENVYSEIAPQGDRQYLLIFTAMGLLILGMACFNYMNLSTARTMPRAGEVGMRKVSGATRGSLVRQFMTEAVVTSLLAFPIALILTEAALPWVYQFMGEPLAYSLLDYPQILLAALGVVVLSGLVSGVYPAFVISSYQPSSIFQNRGGSGGTGSWLQKGMVVLQFAIAVLFLSGTAVIYQQLDYIQQKKLGFNEEQVVRFRVGALEDQYDVFKVEALRNPSVLHVTSGPPPGMGHKNMTFISADTAGGRKHMTVMNVDHDYVETLGLNLIEGESFKKVPEGEPMVILNESAVEWFDLQGEVPGQLVGVGGDDCRIVGIVQDFHNESLKDDIQPVSLKLSAGNNYTGLARLAPGNIRQGMTDLQETWEAILPGRPLELSFLDEDIAAQYRTEQRQATLLSVFAGIAILVACFGLMGMAALLTLNRTKEIGIRKVLGATVANVTRLLSTDFLKLVALGFLIAIPVTWYLMNQWLAEFTFRIGIGADIFLYAGGLIFLLSLLTVSWQSVRAALANPVDSLRSE